MGVQYITIQSTHTYASIPSPTPVSVLVLVLRPGPIEKGTSSMGDHMYQTKVTGDDDDDDAAEDDLVNELLDNMSPFLVLPRDTCFQQQPQPPPFPSLPTSSNLVPGVYSGPTIGDIETALSSNFGRRRTNNAVADQHHLNSPLSLVQLEKKNIFGKKENKYTLKLKSSTGGVADDGYKWRKYGQKSIKNRANPRSYYRCTNPRCNAKKQVERSHEDPEVYIITYEGLHLHYSYPGLLLQQRPNSSKIGSTTTVEGSRTAPAFQHQFQELTKPTANPIDSSHSSTSPPPPPPPPNQQCSLEEEELDDIGRVTTNPRGVLEDIFPSFMENPSLNLPTSSINNTIPSPLQTPSPISSSSCLSWSPMPSSYMEVGLLSNTHL